MQISAAVLRSEIEAKLSDRVPAALSSLAQQTSRLHRIGNQRIDGLLGGGLPVGSVCELTGPDCSGRSSLALSLLAGAAEEGACAYIDVGDSLSPHSAAAAGVELGNLLWVRLAQRTSSQAPQARPMTASRASIDGEVREAVLQGRGGRHPRGEAKGLAPALQQMLSESAERRQRKMEGTPGCPNRPLGLSAASQDQIEWERFNLRRVDETDPLRIADRRAAEAARRQVAAQSSSPAPGQQVAQRPWDRLDRALRATDQVLQSGGFRVVVLDLASVPSEQALRIPSATWFRFRRAALESDAILLLLTQEPCAGSSAACVLACSPGEPPMVRGVLARAQHTAEIARQRTGPAASRKAPGRATSWDATPAWMRAGGR